MRQIEPVELEAWLAGGGTPQLLDVREGWEYRTAHIESSRLVPMGEIRNRLTEFDPEAEIVVICHHGGRSMQVGSYLERQGFTKVYNLSGGVDAWARTVDPTMPVY